MGLFAAARGAIGRTINAVGSTIQRLGDTASGVLRPLGSIAGLAKPAVSLIGAALAPFTDGASMGVAGLVNKGLDSISDGSAAKFADKLSSFGKSMADVGGRVAG